MKPAAYIPWFLTLFTILISAGQFYLTNAQKNREPFLRTQLEFLIEASDALATLAVETDSRKWEASRVEFWKLYWGRLAIVEDPDVEAAMVSAGALVPKTKLSNQVFPMPVLQSPSLKLAHAARDLILASWNIDLPALKGNP